MGDKEIIKINNRNPFVQKINEASNPYNKGNSIFNVRKKPYEEVKEELVSVVILSRNEEFLSQTINNMSELAEGPIEFVIVLDGDYEPEKIIDVNETLHRSHSIQFVCNKEPLGRRPSSNLGAERARGKYLFHLDAHCKTDCKAWDTLLKQSVTTPSTMVIPSLNKLIVPEYKQVGNRNGHKYISVNFKDQWSGNKGRYNLEPTITGNGMGWFLTKEYYLSCGGCDVSSPAYVWGNFGIEWALKTWLCDFGLGAGQVLLTTEVVFAHLWQKKLPYKQPGIGKDRNRLKEMYLDGKAPNQVRPFSFFEENLGHLLPKNKETPEKQPLRVLQEETEPDVTVIMNTNGLYPDLIEEAIQSFINQDYPNKYLKIVSTNKHLKLDREYEDIEIIYVEPFERFPQQIQYALKQVKTPYWCIMDSDDVFSSDHISKLVKIMLREKKNGLKSPCYVGIDGAIEHWVNKGTPKLRNRGWWSCLYDRVPDEKIDEVFNEFLNKRNKDTGSDLHFIKKDFWNKKLVQGKKTAYHRLGVAFHIRNERWKDNYYKNSLETVNNYVPPVLVPKWKKDYDKMINDFNYPRVTLIMNTFQRDMKTLQESIYSFLCQDYPNKKLLIVNSSPKRLVHRGYSPDVEVIDIKSSHHLQEFKNACKHLIENAGDNEFFSIFDDDDVLKPNHISQMVQNLQKNKFKSCINRNYVDFNIKRNSGKEVSKLMWWNGIYPVSLLETIKLGTDLEGFDKRFMEQANPVEYDGEATYIWQRGNVIHESKTNKNSHEEKLDRMKRAKEEAMNRKDDIPVYVRPYIPDPPMITVCMVTYGSHKAKTEEAIQSYINQSYKFKKLLILNTHKDPIKLETEYSDIEIIELPNKKFNSLGEKHEYLINQVDTPYWTVLDDDDIILPWHLETLASALVHNRASYDKPSHKRPLLTGHNRKIISVDNKYSYIKSGSGWTCRVFEKLSPDKVRGKLQKKIKGTSECNYDARFCSGKWHSFILNYPVLPSYVWRGGGDNFHLSAAGDTDEVFNNAFNNAEDEAQKIDNSSVWVPHWEKDYVKEFYYFLNIGSHKQIFGKNHHHLRLSSSGAIRKKEFHFLNDFCKEHNVKNIVEFGSGASTLSFSLEGYNITSYETSEYWRDRVRLFLSYDPIKMWDGKAFKLEEDVDLVFIDGPDPPDSREESFKTAITSNAKYIAAHDVFRHIEQNFIEKYLLQNGYKEIAKIGPTKGVKGPNKLRGIGIYGKE